MPFIKAVPMRPAALMVALAISVAGAGAQTVIKPPKNRYTPQQDVELGREAAAEVRKQYPIISDERITSYLSRLGDRLVAAAPPELNEKVYQYSFTPVNLKEINAFALPGGPMHVHRGMFDAAAAEGEVAGVMAHELARAVAVRDANASSAEPVAAARQLAGAVGGAVVGRTVGGVIAQAPVRLGTPLRSSREHGSRPARRRHGARGYDPRQLARMFETIERESKSSGGSGPQWMSSHPNPGNRTVHHQEAEMPTFGTPADQSGFQPIKAAFPMPPAKSMAEIERGAGGSAATGRALNRSAPGRPVPAPASQYRTMNGGRSFCRRAVELDLHVSSNSSIRSSPERLRAAERRGRVQPRRRVRRREGPVAQPAGSDECLAECHRPVQSRPACRRTAAGDPPVAAIWPRHTARQRIGARRRGTRRALHRVPRRGTCSTT